MPRTKPKPAPPPSNAAAPSADVLTPAEVLTLSDAATYLRLSEDDVLRLVREQNLPARQVGTEWRFFKAAIQGWLSQPQAKYSKEAQQAGAGALKDDPHLEAIVEEIYRQRGRPITEDGSYKLFHELKRETDRQ